MDTRAQRGRGSRHSREGAASPTQGAGGGGGGSQLAAACGADLTPYPPAPLAAGSPPHTLLLKGLLVMPLCVFTSAITVHFFRKGGRPM